MEKLKVIELCSGIGAQIKGIKNTNLFDAETIYTADLDKEVVVSYAAIHCGLTKDLIEDYQDYPSKERMIQILTDKRLGYDFKNDKPYDWNRLAKKRDKTKGIEKYWLADYLSHNLGDMTQIKELPYCDLLTYSCPCTDISIVGKQQGLKWFCQDCGCEYDPSKLNVEDRYICPHCGKPHIKSTRSGLLYEVERILVKSKVNNTLPKFLFMENVDSLVSQKYINSFKDWIDRLDNLGYNSYYQVINAKDTGAPQYRNRIFCISIRKDIDTKSFTFPQPFDIGIRLKDILESTEDVSEKYFLSNEVQRKLNIVPQEFIGDDLKVVRKLTPKECNRLMGFNDIDYDNCKSVGISDTQIYKQSGNSICVSCIQLLIEHLYKAQYDNMYICSGERLVEKSDFMYKKSHKVFNPLKNKTPYGWHFEQNVYLSDGITRALKAGGGSGNIPKVISDIYFSVEDGDDHCLDKLYSYDDVKKCVSEHDECKEVFMYINNELYSGISVEDINI